MGWKFCFSKKAHPIEPEELPPAPRLFSEPLSQQPLEISSNPSICLDSTEETSSTSSPKEANIATVLLVKELSRLKKEGEITTKPEPRRLQSLTTSIPPIPPRLIELVPPTPVEAPCSSTDNNTYFSTIPSTTEEEEATSPLSNPSNSSQTSPDPRLSHTRNDSLSTPPLAALQHPKHRRSSSGGGSMHKFKETLNAFEHDSGEGGTRTINQYVLKGEIGHGSYASVERATDRETGIDYVGIVLFLSSFFVVFILSRVLTFFFLHTRP